jgi:hypothetical protein
VNDLEGSSPSGCRNNNRPTTGWYRWPLVQCVLGKIAVSIKLFAIGKSEVLRGHRTAARVCRAWPVANRVQVPISGIRGAEGYEKGKGVAARLRTIPIALHKEEEGGDDSFASCYSEILKPERLSDTGLFPLSRGGTHAQNSPLERGDLRVRERAGREATLPNRFHSTEKLLQCNPKSL